MQKARWASFRASGFFGPAIFGLIFGLSGSGLGPNPPLPLRGNYFSKKIYHMRGVACCTWKIISSSKVFSTWKLNVLCMWQVQKVCSMWKKEKKRFSSLRGIFLISAVCGIWTSSRWNCCHPYVAFLGDLDTAPGFFSSPEVLDHQQIIEYWSPSLG